MIKRRNTKQRQLILDAVQSRCDHPTAEQIFLQVHEKDSQISLGTVYRNLDLLSKEGLIKGINLSEADRYDLKTENHNHFLCEKCGRVFDISIDYDNSLDSIKTPEGYEIRTHQTIFKGLCPDCLNKNKKENQT